MWNERYAVEEYVYGKKPNHFLAKHTQRFGAGAKILCLAEGEGRNSVYLAGQGFKVSAVDASSVGRDKTLRLAQDKQVSVDYQVADLAHYDMGVNQWDGIVSIFCHLPPDMRKQVHQQVCRALRPGGILLLEAFTPLQLTMGTGGPPSEMLMMDNDILTNELADLSFELLQEIERDVIEGVYHTGRGAVVQLIARK